MLQKHQSRPLWARELKLALQLSLYNLGSVAPPVGA